MGIVVFRFRSIRERGWSLRVEGSVQGLGFTRVRTKQDMKQLHAEQGKMTCFARMHGGLRLSMDSVIGLPLTPPNVHPPINMA